MIGRDRLSSVILQPGATILDAVKAIDAGGIQAALISPDGERLLGMVTDGDIRRAILRGATLESDATAAMNARPVSLSHPSSREQALALMKRLQIRQVPVLDEEGRILGLHYIDSDLTAKREDNETWVVIMAGGRGTRLHPLTENMPKPMIPVGGQPLIETIIRSLIDQGFRRIYLSISFKADMFRLHFGDGSLYGAEIRYIEEETRMGTAGALGLLDERPSGPFIVMNGDLLTAVNFNKMIAYHRASESLATMCVRDYRVPIPFGVVELDGNRVSAIVEKPVKTYFVNAGIYVLEPEILSRVPRGQYLDMTTLLDRIMAEGGSVSSFPIHEYWLDIGRFDDLQQAQNEFDRVFGS